MSTKKLMAMGAGVACLSALCGCAAEPKVPFTQEMVVKYGLTDEDIKNLQFYTSPGFQVERDWSQSDHNVTGMHRLLIVNGRTIEQVDIGDLTPGVSLTYSFSECTIRIAFENEEGGQKPSLERTFLFGTKGHSCSGGYTTYATEKDDARFVNYDGKEYKLNSESQLYIDKDSIDRLVAKRRKLPGIVLPTTTP